MKDKLQELQIGLEGDLLIDDVSRIIYATDASLYFDRPLAVAIPENKKDLEKLIAFASANDIPLTPRAAGTSLAGQATGKGIVVDISKYFRNIIELNVAENWVRVQPGVVRDELNKYLEPYGLMFCPETSTSNRCMIGGMIGNNSCGEHSIIYGSTRDHLISVKCLLSDGSETEFGDLDNAEFKEKLKGDKLENRIYRKINEILSDQIFIEEIKKNYPEQSIKRRNTGYALDILLDTSLFSENQSNPFNLSKLICGSEGTLAFVTEAKLNLVKIPKQKTAFICAHFVTLEQSLKANILILKHDPTAVELIGKEIIRQTKDNISQQANRFFILGEPEAILIIEMAHENEQQLTKNIKKLIDDLNNQDYGFHYPVITGNEMTNVRNLRKAGLGILNNVCTALKPHSFVEDTAVAPEKLPLYIAEFRNMLTKYNVDCAFYGHISTGELHFKPVLNLRSDTGVELLQKIAYDTALLVKKYKGSLSGEHGDGRLRAGFIPLMLGENVYKRMTEIKNEFDPKHIFNRGKIIAAPSVADDLREQRLKEPVEIKTYFDFSKTNGLHLAVDRCNGSADCRKSSIIGGVMCPSYMATLNEDCSTRARANFLREILYSKKGNNPFNDKELYNILDLCLMCKGCKSECPSGIDMTRYKTEFLQHYYDARLVPFRSRMIARITKINKLGAFFPIVFNFFASNKVFSFVLKKMIGFANQRQIPKLGKTTLKSWAKKYLLSNNGKGKGVLFFADEITNYNDVEIGKKAIMLLTRLGFEVNIAPVSESGRTYFSKGLLKKARKLSERNIMVLKEIVTGDISFVGVEPSCILSFRDEVPDIVCQELKAAAAIVAKNSFTIEEFIIQEFNYGNISKEMFTTESRKIKLHGHCHQKALSTSLPTKQMLEIPNNFFVEEIPSGCCGMAGSFGYEKEHYEISMKIGELVLFPEVRSADYETIICAPGSSCRQQIKEGTGTTAFHPVEILFNALI